jgi:hypothetical protein
MRSASQLKATRGACRPLTTSLASRPTTDPGRGSNVANNSKPEAEVDAASAVCSCARASSRCTPSTPAASSRSRSAPLNLVLFGIGCIIGTGIFVLTGRAAANFAGPGIMISFVITGTLCAFVALSYSELAAAIPVSGSAYSYSYASMGEFVAWIMGLLLLLEYGVAASTVAVGWSGYVVSLLHDLGVNIPPRFTAARASWSPIPTPALKSPAS